jgi:hypothetical protein
MVDERSRIFHVQAVAVHFIAAEADAFFTETAKADRIFPMRFALKAEERLEPPPRKHPVIVDDRDRTPG